MKVAKLIFAGILVGTIVDACGGATVQSGSNSNWLDTCASDSDCPSGLECVCGACTKSCASTKDCSDLATGATCAAASPTDVSCTATSHACVLSCSTNDDCSMPGQTLTCSGQRCSKTGAGHSDGGVHGTGTWSSVCQSDADCGSGLSCFCGLCTSPCKTTADCSAIQQAHPELGAAQVTCPTSVEETSACVNNPTFPGSGCAVACTVDGDCASLGSTAVCTGGFCKEPVLVSHSDGGVVTCEDRTVEMNPKIAAVFMNADRSCKTTADCTTVPLGNQCFGDGCTQVAVSSSGANAVTSQLDAIGAQYCSDYFKAGCVAAGLTGCPAEGVAACVNGTCEIPPITRQGSSAETCDDRTQEIQQRLMPYETTAGLACTNDGDCAITDLVSCGGGCGTLISKSGLDDIAEGLTAMEQTLCVPFVKAGCTVLQPPCAFPGTPKCIASQCQTVAP